MQTSGKFVMIVTNGTLFDKKTFQPMEPAFNRLNEVSRQVKKLLLITKVSDQEEQQSIKKILKNRLPSVPEHHFLFCEAVHSIYSLVREFNDPVDIVIDTFEESYNETAKFLSGKYFMANKPLEQMI